MYFRRTMCYNPDMEKVMENVIDGTILIDLGRGGEHSMGRFAGTTLEPHEPVIGGMHVRVDWSGEIVYAVRGDVGERTWWFAGIGHVVEQS